MSIASFEGYSDENDNRALSREDALAMERIAKVKTDSDHTYITPEERDILGDDFSEEYVLYQRVEGSQVVQLGSRVDLDQEIAGTSGKRITYTAIIFSKHGFNKTEEIYDGHDVIPYTSPLGRSILGHRPGEECVVKLSGGQYTAVRITNVD